MPTSSMARHQWAAKLAKRPTIGCRPQPEGAGGIRKPTDSGRAHKGSLLRYRDAERRDGAQTPSRLRFERGRGSGNAPSFAQEHGSGSGSTPAFFVCARKRNVRTRGRRRAPAVSCKWHETELSGGRYIGEAENGRKLNFPSLDPLDSMLSDSESSISCPKSSHEQVEKLGKFETVPKIRARLFGDSESPKSCQPQTEKPAARLRRFLGWAEIPLDPTGNRATLRGIGRSGGDSEDLGVLEDPGDSPTRDAIPTPRRFAS